MYSSSQGCHTATGTHMPHGITQSHSVTCHPAEVTFPPLPQPKLVLDQATPEGCKAELTLDLRTSEWTTCGYVTNSYGYVIVLISHNWIFRLVPYFWGDGEILFLERWGNCLISCQKIDSALIWRVVTYQTAQLMRMGN